MPANHVDVQVADNFRNLFETPVLFYALAAIALALVSFALLVVMWVVFFVWLASKSAA